MVLQVYTAEKHQMKPFFKFNVSDLVFIFLADVLSVSMFFFFLISIFHFHVKRSTHFFASSLAC